MTELRTDRLLLRHWRESDRDPWAAMNADPEVMEYFPSTLTRERADVLFDRVSSQVNENGWGLWAVELDGEFIGFTGLAPVTLEVPFKGSVEVGWRLARSAWGHGYATEAARASVDYAFGELGLDEVVSMATIGNVRSHRVMQKLGMTRSTDDDFEHPALDSDSPLRPHLLYRLRAPR